MYTSGSGSKPVEFSATILNTQSVSNSIDLGAKTLLAIFMPSAWTAANLTFQTSMDNITFVDVYDKLGTEVTVSASTSRYIIVDPADWVGVQYIKVRSGTAGTPVNQAADRIVTLVSKVV